MTLPLLPGPPEPLRCANPFCRKVLKHPGPGGYGPECARQRGLTPPAAPSPARWEQDGPDLFDAAHDTAAPPSNASNDQAECTDSHRSGVQVSDASTADAGRVTGILGPTPPPVPGTPGIVPIREGGNTL